MCVGPAEKNCSLCAPALGMRGRTGEFVLDPKFVKDTRIGSLPGVDSVYPPFEPVTVVPTGVGSSSSVAAS